MVASGRKKMKGEVNSGKVEKRKREGGVIGRDGGIVTKKLDVGKRVTSFARAFASSQRKVRNMALTALSTWLESHSEIPELEMEKLWKAIFYCIWMTDKNVEIEKVIDRLLSLTSVAGMPYLRGMFRCVVSEWHGIDRHRIDKFYSLLSKGIDTGIRNLKPSGEDVPLAGLDAKAVKELMDMLTEEVFDTCERNGKGVTLHCLDKWIDHVVTEVLTSVDEDNEKEVAALYTVVMDPLFRSLRVNDVAIPKRAMETTKELLERWETALDQDDHLKVLEVCGLIMQKTLFSIASDRTVRESVREELYTLWTKSKALNIALAEKAGKEMKGTDILLPPSVTKAKAAKKSKRTREMRKAAIKKRVDKKMMKMNGTEAGSSLGEENGLRVVDHAEVGKKSSIVEEIEAGGKKTKKDVNHAQVEQVEVVVKKNKKVKVDAVVDAVANEVVTKKTDKAGWKGESGGLSEESGTKRTKMAKVKEKRKKKEGGGGGGGLRGKKKGVVASDKKGVEKKEKKVRFSLDDNKVHILPQDQKKRKQARMVILP